MKYIATAHYALFSNLGIWLGTCSKHTYIDFVEIVGKVDKKDSNDDTFADLNGG